MKKGLKLSLVVTVLALTAWICPVRRSEAAYKRCSEMRNCSPNGAWSACWSPNLELFRCFCVGGNWDCSYP